MNEWFLTKDVVNLALMSYLEAIQDGTFFSDKELVCQYFSQTDNISELFCSDTE